MQPWGLLQSGAPKPRGSESSGVAGGFGSPLGKWIVCPQEKGRSGSWEFSERDSVLSFNQLEQLDGSWLMTRLSKDLYGKKDRPALQISGLSRLP